MFRLIYKLKRIRKTDVANVELENLVESGLDKMRPIDPETDTQWLHLKNAMETNRNARQNRLAFPEWILSRPALSFAVAGMIIIIVGFLWMRDSSISTYQTTKGQRSEIKLKDSTEIFLNYMSELKVERWSVENSRNVIFSGEGLFRVRRNGTPFVITTDIGTIQVLGTEFNVRARDEKMEVAVLEGSVRVSINKDGKDSNVVVCKDQIIICEKNSYPEIPKTIPFSEYPGWIRGKFMFYRTSYIAACKELALQFDITVKLEGSLQQGTTITGIVNGGSIKDALTTLAQLTGSKYRYENGSYIIY